MKLKTAIEYWDFYIKKYYQYDKSPQDNLLNVAKAASDYDTIIQFLKQPLQLWMFIPCDKEGEPLEKPDRYDNWLKNQGSWMGADLECKEYQQACDRVLFEGFKLVNENKESVWCQLSNFNTDIIFIKKDYRTKGAVTWNGEYVKTVESLSGKVDLVEKVAEQFKY